MKRLILILVAVTLAGAVAYAGIRLRPKLSGATVESRLAGFGADADARWKPYFEKAGVAYPAKRYTFVVFKDAKTLSVFAPDAGGSMRLVRTMPVLAAGGGPGPKTKQGDNQVPEGVYGIESLNPRSLYHVALRVNYPNADDRARAKAQGRTTLGGDIMIHGKAASIGCLAMGDGGAEDLFTLAARAGCKAVTLLIAPTDLRKTPGFAPPAGAPAWTAERYAELKKTTGRAAVSFRAGMENKKRIRCSDAFLFHGENPPGRRSDLTFGLAEFGLGGVETFHRTPGETAAHGADLAGVFLAPVRAAFAVDFLEEALEGGAVVESERVFGNGFATFVNGAADPITGGEGVGGEDDFHLRELLRKVAEGFEGRLPGGGEHETVGVRHIGAGGDLKDDLLDGGEHFVAFARVTGELNLVVDFNLDLGEVLGGGAVGFLDHGASGVRRRRSRRK